MFMENFFDDAAMTIIAAACCFSFSHEFVYDVFMMWIYDDDFVIFELSVSSYIFFRYN